MWESHISFCFS